MVQIIDGEVVRDDRPCKHCGVMIHNPSPQKIFCSANCGTKWWVASHKRPNNDKPCKQCGEIMEEPRANKVYCSHECTVKWHSNQKKIQRVIEADTQREAESVRIANGQ